MIRISFYFFIVSPGWDDHSTIVKQSFHVGETIVPQPWNDKISYQTDLVVVI